MSKKVVVTFTAKTYGYVDVDDNFSLEKATYEKLAQICQSAYTQAWNNIPEWKLDPNIQPQVEES